jgi:PAS domain S-box-containing protein
LPHEINLAQLYFDMPDVMIIAINNEGKVKKINKKGCEILGYTREEILGKNWFENFLPERLRDRVGTLFRQMIEGTIPLEHYENPILTKKGEERIISWHNILLKNETEDIVGTLSSGADITELKKTEKALKESEERFRSTVENMREGYQIIDRNWHYAYINDAAAIQGRRTKEELQGQSMKEMYPGIENTEMFSQLRNCMTKRMHHQMENEFIFPDGSKGWFELRMEPVPEGILILSLDVTKRKQIEKELDNYRQRLEQVIAQHTVEYTKTNEKLRRKIAEQQKTEEGLKLRAAILDNTREAIFLINLHGDFTYANQAAAKTYGYNRDEFFNMNMRQLMQPKEATRIESILKEVREKGQTEIETIHLRKNQTYIPVQVRYSLMKTPHGQFVVSVVRAMTN